MIFCVWEFICRRWKNNTPVLEEKKVIIFFCGLSQDEVDVNPSLTQNPGYK
jgi:hypothetical protein